MALYLAEFGSVKYQSLLRSSAIELDCTYTRTVSDGEQKNREKKVGIPGFCSIKIPVPVPYVVTLLVRYWYWITFLFVLVSFLTILNIFTASIFKLSCYIHYPSHQGCGSGLDPDSVTLLIRIRIGNPDRIQGQENEEISVEKCTF
jgi:hypothetical protein